MIFAGSYSVLKTWVVGDGDGGGGGGNVGTQIAGERRDQSKAW